MGAKLIRGFELAQEEGGVKAQMRLAIRVGFSSDKAGERPDSPELVQKMEAALEELVGKPMKL